MTRQLQTLTEYEKLAVAGGINLSDGHARHRPSPSQASCIEAFYRALASGGTSSIKDAEERFLSSHFSVAGQGLGQRKLGSRSLICHSASAACEVVGNYLRLRRLSVALIQPTFDNIPNILRRHGIRIEPLDDKLLSDDSIVSALLRCDANALFLVIPNNPTGASVTPELFSRILNVCHSKSMVLILDFAFRLFDENLDKWDQYELLERSGVSYLAIEDTGKVWPIDDLKVGILTTSRDIYRAVEHIHDDFLLNVSGSLLHLLSDLSDLATSEGLDASVRAPLVENGKAVREILEQAGLTWLNRTESFSVAWLDSGKTDSAQKIYNYCSDRGIHILPGNLFFWNDPKVGSRYIRVALARPVKALLQGSKVVSEAVELISVQPIESSISPAKKGYRR
jgi:aspartate/methionine/tyrosine aminotransferase